MTPSELLKIELSDDIRRFGSPEGSTISKITSGWEIAGAKNY